MTDITIIEKKIRQESKKLLEEKKVIAVLGYTSGYDKFHPIPYIATYIDEVNKFIFNEYCTMNIVRYIHNYPLGTRLGIVLKGSDSRALVILIQEGKVKREDLILLGIPFKNFTQKNNTKFREDFLNRDNNPIIWDILLSDLIQRDKKNLLNADDEEILRLENMTSDERWIYWKVEFSKCIRCYACRKVCPMCYCKSCFIDQNNPLLLVDKSTTINANFMYHLTRFYHLAGRCINCGSCSRACPVNIPLYLFHKKISKECEKKFNQIAGININDKPVLIDFQQKDTDLML